MSWHSYVMVDIAAVIVIVIVIVIGICTLIHVVSRSSPGCCAEQALTKLAAQPPYAPHSNLLGYYFDQSHFFKGFPQCHGTHVEWGIPGP